MQAKARNSRADATGRSEFVAALRDNQRCRFGGVLVAVVPWV